MVKVLLLFLALAGVYLFYPFWDLSVREDPFSSHYSPVAKGFWTRDACHEAADAQHARNFRCRKHANFERFLSASHDYGHSADDIR